MISWLHPVSIVHPPAHPRTYVYAKLILGCGQTTCIIVMSVVGRRVLAQFKNEEGLLVGAPFDLPLETDQESLLVLCNALLENVKRLIFYDIFSDLKNIEVINFSLYLYRKMKHLMSFIFMMLRYKEAY